MKTPRANSAIAADIPIRAGLWHWRRPGLASAESVRLLPASHSVGKAFRRYEPAIDLFPVNLWSRVTGRVLRRAPRSLYGQGDARGVRCDAGQIIITAGAQQGLDLISRLLLDAGDAAWVEDPDYREPCLRCGRRALA